MILDDTRSSDFKIFWEGREIELPDPSVRQMEHKLVLVSEAIRQDDDPNGKTIDATREAWIKYEYTVLFKDIWLPLMSGLLVGKLLTLHTVYPVPEPVWLPQQRAHVPGSMRFLNVEMADVDEEDAIFRVYHPILVARLKSDDGFSVPEWDVGISGGWTFREQERPAPVDD
jgi:hypothetical protein